MERAPPTCHLLYIAVAFADYVFVVAVVAAVFVDVVSRGYVPQL